MSFISIPTVCRISDPTLVFLMSVDSFAQLALDLRSKGHRFTPTDLKLQLDKASIMHK